MESPAKDKTPSSEVKLYCKNSALHQIRSASTPLSKSGLTPCRRVGLKRKSTPGVIFQSPLKDNNSRICDQTATPLAPSFKRNNLFSKTPNQWNHGEDVSKKEKATGTSDLLKNESDPNNVTVKTKQKLGTPKIATPILSRQGLVVQSSLSKKLKLSSDSSTYHNECTSENSPLYLMEVTETLEKNHDSFLKLYHEFISENQEDGAKIPQKCEVIIQMKYMVDQIEELKQLLINAKQHNISKLEALTKKWKEGCQKALHSLLEKLQQQGHTCDMSQLLLESGIPNNLVNYDEDIQDFVV